MAFDSTSVAASSSVLARCPVFSRFFLLDSGFSFFQHSRHVVYVVISSSLFFLDRILLLLNFFWHLSQLAWLLRRLSLAWIFLYEVVAAPATVRVPTDLAAVSLFSISPRVSISDLVSTPAVPSTSFLMSWSARPFRMTCLMISSQYEMYGAFLLGQVLLVQATVNWHWLASSFTLA